MARMFKMDVYTSIFSFSFKIRCLPALPRTKIKFAAVDEPKETNY
jgi:hypothetical protein